MTYIYQWYSFPKQYSIQCRNCKEEALFTEEKTRVRQKSPIKGKSSCLHCGYNGEHTVIWPEEAYYKVEIRGNILWAWDKECVKDLIKYIRSEERNTKKHKHRLFLTHLPKAFQKAKHRDEIISKLSKLLGEE